MNIRTVLMGLTFSLGVATAANAQTRFTISADGSEVTDNHTSLTWRRCVEGMTVSGAACSGSPLSLTHSGAFARAKTQEGWRLPNVKELASIVDDAVYDNGGSTVRVAMIDPAAFPNTPRTDHWASTPQVGFPALAWLVSFYNGLVSDYIFTQDRNILSSATVHVRLVKSSP
jgi:Protein of unknown function (DUF1566)